MIFNIKNLADIEQKIQLLKCNVVMDGLTLEHSLDLFAAHLEKGDIETARWFIEDEEKGIFHKEENTSIRFYNNEYSALLQNLNQENPHLTAENFKKDVFASEKALHALRSGHLEEAARQISMASSLSENNLFYQGLKLIITSLSKSFKHQYQGEMHWQRAFTNRVEKYLKHLIHSLGEKNQLGKEHSETLIQLIYITDEINFEPWIDFRQKGYSFSAETNKTVQIFAVMAAFLVALKESLEQNPDKKVRETIRYHIPSERLEDLARIWSDSPYTDRLFEMIEIVENPQRTPKTHKK